MTKLIFDSWAWMEYLDASKKGEAVKRLVEKNDVEIYSSAVSLAEVISKSVRAGRDSRVALQAITSLSKVVFIDDEIAAEAGKTHAFFKKSMSDFGLADAFVIATAAKLNAKIVTGDPHFREVKGVILL